MSSVYSANALFLVFCRRYSHYFQHSTPARYPVSKVPGEMKASCLLQSLIRKSLELVQEESKNRLHTNVHQVSSFSVLFLRKGNLLNLSYIQLYDIYIRCQVI